MRLRRPLPAVQGDTLHIVGVGDNRIGKQHCTNYFAVWAKYYILPNITFRYA